MFLKGIKRGKSIELLEELDIPDEQEIIIAIPEGQLVNQAETAKVIFPQNKLSFSELLQKFREEENLEEEGIEPEELLEGVRDSLPGREVVW